jgi:putative FmdB family regulatory protein
MPLYEFKCPDERKCGHQFEELVPMGTEQKPCPKCGAPAKHIPSGGQRFHFNWFES